MENISTAENFVRFFYNKYNGRVAIGVGYTIHFTEIFPFVFKTKDKDSVGIIAIDAVPDEDRDVYIYHLGAFETGCGIGSAMLKELCEQADKFNVILKVSPNAMPNGLETTMNTKQLFSWYKRYGFRGDSGLSRIPKRNV